MGARQPENTRSFALVAHGGAGKTTLAEAMLFCNRQIGRMGRTDAGNTVSDFQTEEQKRQIYVFFRLAALSTCLTKKNIPQPSKIGRASCRERV